MDLNNQHLKCGPTPLLLDQQRLPLQKLLKNMKHFKQNTSNIAEKLFP